MDTDNNKKKEDKIIDKVAIATGNADTVSRYGSANGEHIVAYKGIDNETGQIYSKGLKQISESRVHPDYKKSNIKQQSGYSAEVKSAAKKMRKSISMEIQNREHQEQMIFPCNQTAKEILLVELTINFMILQKLTTMECMSMEQQAS